MTWCTPNHYLIPTDTDWSWYLRGRMYQMSVEDRESFRDFVGGESFDLYPGWDDVYYPEDEHDY